MDSRLLQLFIVVALLPLVLTACQSGEAESVTLEEHEGVTYVVNRGGGMWTDHDNPPLAFELEQVYGSDDGSEAMLAEATALAVDDEGILYVLDRRDHRLVAFSPDGSLLWTAGRQGEGPGEFNNPLRGMIWDGADDLYIANQAGSRIDRWRTDGTFVETYATGALDLSTAFPVAIDDSHLLLESPIPGQQAVDLHRVDLEAWEIIDSATITLSEEPEDVSFSIRPVLVHDENRLLTTYGQREYSVIASDLSGSFQRVITREVDHLLGRTVHEANQNFYIMDYSALEGPWVLPGGYLLTSAYWATNVRDPDEHIRLRVEGRAEPVEYSAALDLFDPEGRFLASLQWEDTRTPEIGDLHLATADGLLYTFSDDPYPQVRRYRVHINEP